MQLSLVFGCLWIIVASLIAMVPSKRNHWPQAYGLIAAGVPILAWVFWEAGVLMGLAVLAAGASILRWPLRYLGRWAKARLGGGQAQ